MFMFWVIVIACFLCGLWPVGLALLCFVFLKSIIVVIGQILVLIKDLFFLVLDVITSVLMFVGKVIALPFRLIFSKG